MEIYCDYNLLERLVNQRAGGIGNSNRPTWKADHDSLERIYEYYKNKKLLLVICRADALEEFAAYNRERMKSYNEIRGQLEGKMLRKFDIFELLVHKELLIYPWGDYGWGCGPWGGGQKSHYKLLDRIREAVGNETPENSKDDRDARHLMHSVLYGCDFFLTMDYKTIVDKLSPMPKNLEVFLEKNGFSLNIVTPSELIGKL